MIRPDPSTAPWRIRWWHFLVLPTLAMALALVLSRWLDQALVGDLTPLQQDVYGVLRTVAIALLMSAVMAWLAINYRGQYEADLRETRDFLARIIDGSGEAIVTLDADGRVTSWNPAAERIYGWSAREMIGHQIGRLVPDDPQVQRELREMDARIRTGETVTDFQTRRVRKDGSPIVVRITRSPLLDSEGTFEGSTGIVRDVTSMIDMETRLVERERLAAVGELSAQVAHEVRNPLAGIRGAVEMLMGGFEQQGQREVAEEVLRQIDRLAFIVDELLLFARPARVSPKPTDLHTIIERVLVVFREEPSAQHLELVRDYDRGLPEVPVDLAQIEQVLFNILRNAAQVITGRGTITVRTFREKNRAAIAIRDTGPGLPEGGADRIFEPFFTTRTEGTGLGLAIVRKIVQAHGGTVVAVAPDGGGAEFQIRLPLGA